MPLTDAAAHASFTAFVRECSDRLHDVAWLVTRNADDAKDAVQDALAGLYRHWSMRSPRPMRCGACAAS